MMSCEGVIWNLLPEPDRSGQYPVDKLLAGYLSDSGRAAAQWRLRRAVDALTSGATDNPYLFPWWALNVPALDDMIKHLRASGLGGRSTSQVAGAVRQVMSFCEECGHPLPEEGKAVLTHRFVWSRDEPRITTNGRVDRGQVVVTVPSDLVDAVRDYGNAFGDALLQAYPEQRLGGVTVDVQDVIMQAARIGLPLLVDNAFRMVGIARQQES